MASEHETTRNDSPMMCKKAGCGFFGSQGNMGLCSTCFRETVLKTQPQVVAIAAVTPAMAHAQEPLNPRCGHEGCRKRMAVMMGFKCRCGNMYCAMHRYTNMHNCTFDYKAAGKEAITKANPLVVKDKILKF